MRKVSLLLLFSLSFLACKKDDKDGSPPGNKNTVTYTTNGQTYTVSENVQVSDDQIRATFVNCTVQKDNRGWSNFFLKIEGTNLPFNMQIISPKGEENGLGNFTIKDLGDIVTEKFTGGQSYTLIGGEVNVTELTPSKITGTYQFSLKNSSLTKTATGTFTINQPIE